MVCIHFNKIYRYFIEIKQNPPEVSSSISTYDLLDTSRNKDRLRNIDKNIYVSVFKTEYEEAPSVLFLFVIDLDKKVGVLAFNEIILGLVEYLERNIGKLDDISYFKDQDKRIKKNLGFLKIIKKLNKEDFLG